MRILTNTDHHVQPLSKTERKVLFFINHFANQNNNNVTVGVQNIAGWIEKTQRTVIRILNNLIKRGLINRQRKGRGFNALTKLTALGKSLVAQLMRKKGAHERASKGEKSSHQMSHQMSHQNRSYLRSINHKISKPTLSLPIANVVENKVVELPKLLGEGFVKTAQKVLSKINCALQVKVAKEFDSFAAKQVVRNPIAFLRHKINQLVALEAHAPVVPNRIATEQLKTEIKAKALDLAKDELKRNGKGYPVFNPGMSTAQHFDDVQAYGVREAELYRFYERKLEDEMKVTKSNC